MTAPAIVALMVGRAVDEMYPRTPRTRGEALARGHGLRRDRRSRCIAARCSGSPASSAPAGRGCCARSSGSRRSRRGACASARGPARPTRGASGSSGVGFLSEDRKGEGLALGLSVADNLTASRLDGLGPGPLVLPSRLDARGVAAGSSGSASSAAVRGSRPASCRAATSRRSRSRGCCTTTWTSLILDEPTRGIDVGSKAQIYRVPRRAACRTRRGLAEGGAAREQLPPGAARRCAIASRSCGADAARTRAARDRLGRAPPDDGCDRRRRCRMTRGRLLDTGGPILGLLFVSIVFGLLVGPDVLPRREPRAHRAADGHRLHGRARHDARHRGRRHRSVGRLGRRAQHRRHRARCFGARLLARPRPRSAASRRLPSAG